MKSSNLTRIIRYITSGGLIFYALSGISSILNYAFYPAVARFVSTAQYGEIQFLVSMFTQLAVGFVVLNILAIIIGVEVKDTKKSNQMTRSLTVTSSMVIGGLVTIGTLVLLTQQDVLQLSSSPAILLLGLSLIINVPFTIEIGRLQGAGMFLASGVVGTLGALFKLVFSALFVMAGFGVTGAIAGIALGMTCTLLLLKAIKYAKKIPTPVITHVKASSIRFLYARAAYLFIAVSILTLLSAIDSVFSRILLSPAQAGEYAAISTIAKIILAATSPIMWLAIPVCLRNDTTGLRKLLSITVVVSLVASIVFTAWTGSISQIILGISPDSFNKYMPLVSLSMTALSVAFITYTSLASLGRGKLTLLIAIGSIGVFALTTIASHSLDATLFTAILYGQLAASTATAILSFLVLRKSI